MMITACPKPAAGLQEKGIRENLLDFTFDLARGNALFKDFR